jgi:hypothetical protein
MDSGRAARDASRIAQQLKTVYELPTELTPKLIALMAAMEKPKEERN